MKYCLHHIAKMKLLDLVIAYVRELATHRTIYGNYMA